MTGTYYDSDYDDNLTELRRFEERELQGALRRLRLAEERISSLVHQRDALRLKLDDAMDRIDAIKADISSKVAP